MDYSRERRLINRADIKNALSVEFDYNQKHYNGEIKDISELGAKIQLETDILSPGSELRFQVHTPEGNSEFSGQVRWCDRDGGTVKTGIRFSALPSDPHDPIREYIHSVF